MNRRKFLVYSAGAVGAMSLPLGSSVAFAKAKGTYTYLTPFTLSLAFAPVLYASASGDYDKLGVNVKVEVGRGAGQAIQLVAAKQVEAGRTGGANYLAARAQDNSDVLAFGTVSQISPFVVISSESHPIRDAKELAGKVVGVASFGGSMEATLNLMLAKAGVDPKSVRRERVADGPASFAMVEAGRIAAFFGNASTVSRLRAAELPLVVLSVDDGVPGQVYVASEENLASNRDQHVAFLQGTRNAILAMADMDDAQLLEVIRTIAGRFDVPGIEKEDIALGDLKGNRELWLAHGKENVLRNVPEQWDEATRLLRGAGLMKETSRQLYTNAIWESTVV